VLFEGEPDPNNPAMPLIGKQVATDKEVAESFSAWLKEVGGNERPVFVSDNVAWDWQWIAALFDRADMDNPFGPLSSDKRFLGRTSKQLGGHTVMEKL
jgi:hypothetical protein